MHQNDRNTLYFVDDNHKLNYKRCVEKFQCHNREYLATCYLAAHPGIFKCFSLHHQDDGPLDWYFEHLESASEHHSNEFTNGDTSPLTGQTTALVHLAHNLWNGHKLDLAEGLAIWDSDLYRIALQAIDLRRRAPELTIH